MKKKKYLKIIIPFFALALLTFLGFEVVSKIQHKEQIAENILNIPAFSYQLLNGADFTNNDILKTEPVVFIYFNSECHYCQNEAEEIKTHREKLNDVQLIFVSNENPETIKNFAQNYELLGYKNIQFLSDEDGNFAETFDATSVPYILIYNQHHELVEKRKGQTKVSFILRALQKNGKV